jgi:peptidoglycan/LPS O-acetylase OafA/YrhL
LNRSPLIDAIKAVASQLIVLHHLALYAPMTDAFATAWPAVMDFLSAQGRLAVQPFLVIGGFLTAQALERRRGQPPLPQIAQRYLRLAPPLWLALLLVVLATALVGRWLPDADWLSPLPSVGTLLAHLFFLQDVLGVPALSAGVWYVAIDFQLFALFAVLAWAVGPGGWPLAATGGPALAAMVALATVASIVVFSRLPALDVWAIYFLSAYGLGALAAWAAGQACARWWFALAVAVLLADWLIAPRARPLLALATASALYGAAHLRWSAAAGAARGLQRVVRFLADASYGVFVGHFAVIILFSGLWHAAGLSGLAAALAFAGLAWASSIALGAGLQRAADRWTPRWTPRWRIP